MSFLRGDHTFLTTALHHPTARFLAFRNLAPLVHSPQKLAYVPFSDIEPLVGASPFEKTEAQMLQEYDSATTVPQMIFLGLDQRKSGGDGQVEGEGMTWKVYKGRPMWAVDVTPRGTIKEMWPSRKDNSHH